MNNEIPIPVYWAYGKILFFAGVVFLITQAFNKGAELQSENDLTI